MPDNLTQNPISMWTQEIGFSLLKNKSLCVALFSSEGDLLFANPAMETLFSGDPKESLINPKFNKLLEYNNDQSLIYDGFLTIGDYASVNTSIMAHVHRKNNQLFIIGGVDMEQLNQQNKDLHDLNQSVNNLHRQLLKEKFALESALSRLGETNKKLSNLIATKDKLFSIIAHDLRSPFNIISGFSELLMENAFNYPRQRIKEFASNIFTTSKQTFSLLENLLNWSSLQTGILKPDKQKLKPSEIISTVLSMSAENARSKNIGLKSEIYCDKYIMADRHMLETILRNLISNALKFTLPKGLVKVHTECSEGNIVFTVSDTGVGIEPKHIRKIFNVDSNLSTKGTNNEKGTGLGLILSKEFVENHEGKIWVTSEINKGSQFTFSLPIAVD